MPGKHVVWTMGAAYAASTFAAGFVLGAVRVLLVTPLVGPVAAVMLELPIMLAVAWFLCGLILDAPWASRRLADRWAMGGVAFALLMGLEFAMALLVFRQDAGQVLKSLTAPAGLLGLLGQVAFALLPLIPRPSAAPQNTTPSAATFPAAWPRADA